MSNTPEGLIDLFRGLDPNRYCGSSFDSCLVGLPVYQGQLRDEWAAYCKAYGEAGVSDVEWLALRYNVDSERLAYVYNLVAEYDSLRFNHGDAVELAELIILKGYDPSDALDMVDATNNDDDYYDDGQDY